MKKQFSILLSLVLSLSLAGCTMADLSFPEEEIPETTVFKETQPVPEIAPPKETLPEFPSSIDAEIIVEGEPVPITMELFNGGDYQIYLTPDDWQLVTAMEEGFLTDRWTCGYNDTISLRVISLGDMTVSRAQETVTAQNPQVSLSETEEGMLSGTNLQEGFILEARILSEDQKTFAILSQYPLEAGDGFAPRTRAIMDTFQFR